jgi:hypothetical protein
MSIQVRDLVMWCALSDEKSGLQFPVFIFGHRQRSLSQVWVPQDSWAYFIASISETPPAWRAMFLYSFHRKWLFTETCKISYWMIPYSRVKYGYTVMYQIVNSDEWQKNYIYLNICTCRTLLTPGLDYIWHTTNVGLPRNCEINLKLSEKERRHF